MGQMGGAMEPVLGEVSGACRAIGCGKQALTTGPAREPKGLKTASIQGVDLQLRPDPSRQYTSAWRAAST